MCKGGGSSGGGQNTNTVVQQSAPPQQFLDAYQNVVNQARNTAATPYTTYPGQIVADLTGNQQTAYNLAQGMPGGLDYYTNAALNYINNAGNANLSGAFSPYGGMATTYGSQAANLAGGWGSGAWNAALSGTNLAGVYGSGAAGSAAAAPGIAGIYGAGAAGAGNAGWLNATNAANAAATPAYSTVGNFLSPYINSVVAPTAAQFANMNAIQNAGVVGNAAAQGAWGGNRSGVAQGITAGQQATAEAPVIAGLYNQGYQQALAAAQQQQQLQLGAGQLGLGGAQLAATTGLGAGQLGLGGQQLATQGQLGAGQLGIAGGQLGATTGLGAGTLGANTNIAAGNLANQTGAQALGAAEAQAWLQSQAAAQTANLGAQNLQYNLGTIGALDTTGGLFQAQNQAQLNVPYYQFLAAQAYPFQTTGWEANIAEGLGAGAGGTSRTTTPGASPFSQALGLGVGGAGLIGATGGFGSSGWLTGQNGILGGLFGGGSSAGGFNPALDAAALAGPGNAIGAGADALATGLFDVALGGASRGGRVDYQSGGTVGSAEDAALFNALDAFGSPRIGQLARGGIIGVARQGGGMVPFQFSSTPYQQLPNSGNLPNIGISVVPQTSQLRGGMGPPRPPAPAPTDQTFTPQGILGDLKSSGALGPSGWLTGMMPSSSARGGIVPSFQDGGNLEEPEMAPPRLRFDAPVGDIVSGGQLGPLTDEIIRREGGSPKGVSNNPGNIKFAGLPGQTDSGVRATDGGTFASYDNPDAGRQAIGNLVVNAARGGSRAYGNNPTVASFLNTYEGHPENRAAPQQTAPRGIQTASAGVSDIGPGDQDRTGYFRVNEPSGVAPSIYNESPPDAGGIIGRPSGLYSPGVNPWLALAAAGFATAAGRSPQPLQNIGAGFLQGVGELERERAQLPEQQLRTAQAELAQAEVGTWRAQQEWNRERMLGVLDKNVATARGHIAGQPETTAQPSGDGNIVAPLAMQSQPAGSAATPSPVTSAVAAATAAMPKTGYGSPDWYDQQYAQLQDQLRYLQSYPVRPGEGLQREERISAIQQQIFQRTQEDPRLLAQKTAVQEWAKVNPAAAQEAAKGAAGFPYSRQGAPRLEQAFNPQTGFYDFQWVTPPMPGQPAGAPIGGQPSTGGAATTGVAPAGMVAKPGPTSEKIMAGIGEEAAKNREEVLNTAEAARGQQVTLQRMKMDAPNMVQGPFAPWVQEAGRFLRYVDPTWDRQVASFEDYVKNSGALVRQAVRETSSRAAVQEFKLIGETLPSPEISPQGFNQVADEYMGLNDYRIAMARAQTQWEQAHGGPGQVANFTPYWQSHADPYTFVMMRMAQPERQQVLQKLNQTAEGRREIQVLNRQAAWVTQNGLEP